LNTDDEAVMAPERGTTPLDPRGAGKNTRERAR
jgi:hypothetical protein